jgi:hypothetical protein
MAASKHDNRTLLLWTGGLLVLLAAAGVATFLLLPADPPAPAPVEYAPRVVPAGPPLPLYDAVLDDPGAAPRAVIVDVLYPPAATAQESFEQLIGVLNEGGMLPGRVRLTGFDHIEGELIATVDLVADATSLADDSWYQSLQGSTGGRATELRTLWNLLQPHYQGEWPGALRFSYRGEPMPELDHADLSGTIRRDQFSR